MKKLTHKKPYKAHTSTKILLIVFSAALFTLLGFIINEIISPKSYTSQSQFDGCWAKVKSGADKGDWVCVNVRDMKYERAVEVCKHEVGHEIFAEVCEEDIDKCFEVIENVE